MLPKPVSVLLSCGCVPILAIAMTAAALSNAFAGVGSQESGVSGRKTPSTTDDAGRTRPDPQSAIRNPQSKDHASKSPEAVVAEAHYTATVDDGVARISCRLVVTARRDAWCSVPIDFGDTAVGTWKVQKDQQEARLLNDKHHGSGVRSIKPQLTPTRSRASGPRPGKRSRPQPSTLNPQPSDTAFLRGLGDGRFALAVKGKGRHEVQLQLLSRVTAKSGATQFVFSGPPAGIATLDLTLPGENRQVAVRPGFVPGKATSAKGKTHVAGNLTAAKRISVAWSPKRPATPNGKPAFNVETTTLVRVRDAAVFTDTRLEFQPARGRLSQLAIAVPKDHRILDVKLPAGIATGWSVAKGEPAQRIEIPLKRAASGNLIVRLCTRHAFGKDAVELAGIHAVGAAHETGLVAVARNDAWSIALEKPDEWLRLRPAELPPDRRIGDAVACFRYYNPGGVLQATIAAVKPHVSLSHTADFDVGASRLAVDSRLDFRIGLPGRSTLSFKLPAGLTIDAVVGKHVKSFALDDSQDPRVVRIVLDERLSGVAQIHVRGSVDLSERKRPAELTLPLIEPIDATAESGRIRVAVAEGIAAAIDGGKSAGLTPATASGRSAGEKRFTIERAFFQRPVRAVLRWKDAVPVVRARVGTMLQLGESSTRVESRLEFDVRQAPLQRFRLAVPEGAVEGLRITDAQGTVLPVRSVGPLKGPQATPAAPADSGWRIVAFEAREPVVGKATFHAAWEQTRPDTSGGNAVVVDFVSLRVTGLADAQSPATTILTVGELTVKPARSLKIAAKPAAGITPVAPGGARFRYAREPARLSLSVVKLAAEPAANTVVSRGLVEVLLGEQPTATYRCRYRVLTRDRRRLRLDLPKSAEPLAVLVNGTALRLERDPSAKSSEEWHAFLLDVAAADAADGELRLAVQFRMPLEPAPFQTALGRVRLMMPRIMTGDNSPAIVQELRTSVWAPESMSLVGGAKDFARRDGDSDLDAWIGVDSEGLLAFPTAGREYRFGSLGGADRLEVTCANMPFLTWVLSVPFLLLGFLLAKTSLHNKAGTVLLLSFAAALAAVHWPDETRHALFAARFGLIGAAAVWIVNGLLAARHHVASPSPPVQPERKPARCPLPLGGPASVVIPPPGLFPEKPARRPAA